MKIANFVGSALASVAITAGCAEQAEVPDISAATPAPEAQAAPVAVERLPVSLNSVMVALVNQAADPIWVAAWRNPESEADWRELERRAVQLELGGTLLTVPGTGPLDDTWTSNPDWQQWAEQLREAGSAAASAVKARDVSAVAAVGDTIVQVCEGCHMDFKLALPTGGEFGELSRPAAHFQY